MLGMPWTTHPALRTDPNSCTETAQLVRLGKARHLKTLGLWCCMPHIGLCIANS